MPKAINWPAPYRDIILAEDTEQLLCAFRLGTLYFEGRYWAPDEPVDIRCNHLKVRPGIVRGDLVKTNIGALDTTILKHQKPDLQSIEAIKEFFATHYSQTVDNATEITVVYYQNLPLDADYMDNFDPTGRYI